MTAFVNVGCVNNYSKFLPNTMKNVASIEQCNTIAGNAKSPYFGLQNIGTGANAKFSCVYGKASAIDLVQQNPPQTATNCKVVGGKKYGVTTSAAVYLTKTPTIDKTLSDRAKVNFSAALSGITVPSTVPSTAVPSSVPSTVPSAADKAAAEKAAADKAAADQAAADRATADKIVADKAAADKAAADKIVADKAAADKAAADKIILDKAAAYDDILAQKAKYEKQIATQKAAEEVAKLAADKAEITRLSIEKSKKEAAEKVINVSKRLPFNSLFVGCYKDSADISQKVIPSKNITTVIDTCNNLAQKAGSPFFSLQNWEKDDFATCFFGDSKLTEAQFKKFGTSSDCIISNDDKNYYGTNLANAVYRTKFDSSVVKNDNISMPQHKPELKELFFECTKAQNKLQCVLHFK